MNESTTLPIPNDDWVRDDSPDVYYMLRGVDGDGEALRWLDAKAPILGLFTRALNGDRHALAVLRHAPAAGFDELCAVIATFDHEEWLRERDGLLHQLFAAVKGNDDARRRLKRKRIGLARLAEAVRARYLSSQGDAEDAPSRMMARGATVPRGAAADVGCLIGEMHLRHGDHVRAVEAFSRSLDSSPTADAYQGRARAYRALAEADERRARELGGTD
jgi:hypothetical protein